jgi:hypothetical protein
MDVKDSPWRPPRERQSEGGRRGEKFCVEQARIGQSALPPGASRPGGGAAAPHARQDLALKPHPPPPAPQTFFPSFLVPSLNVLFV